MLIRNLERNGESGRWNLSVRDAIGDDLDSQTLCIADRFVTSQAITHHPWQFEGLGNPAAVFLAFQVYREVHNLIILRR